MSEVRLSHKLKNRHLQMIALGGVIGSGLFFGSAKSIHLTGPSIVLSYLLGGLVIYIIMRALGEMTVDRPSPGSFSEYAHNYIGPYAGFISGWSAWFQYTIVCMVELTAVTVFSDILIPGIPHWLLCIGILVFFTFINLLSIRVFGEFEFWFAGIKIVAIILMLLFSAYLIFFKHGINPEVSTYSNPHLFFAGGIGGFLTSLVVVIFSFGGTEFVSIASGESENPKKNVPKAINGVLIRIIMFYILTMLAIILLYPYQKLATNISPFVDVFNKVGFHYAAVIMDFVAITVALSAFNSCMYSASRMLFNLSHHGYAPRMLAQNEPGSKRQVPVKTILCTSFSVIIAVFINYLFPEKAFMYLLTVATSAILIVWFIILVTHMYFRRQKDISTLAYKLKLFPFSNIFAMSILLLVMGKMTQMSDMRLSVFVTPLWIFILSIVYVLKKKNNVR
ncbi:MAG: aromatic amino acid transporter AroP [Burkholderiales bacterium]|jgi:L-asparagine transporter-like permease|nr:aromatic amino acid transporter AroP [Burkholderiales bacterium]